MDTELTEAERAALVVGDEVLISHTIGYSSWTNIGVVASRTAKQVTVRAGGQNHAVRSRSRQYRLGRVTDQWRTRRAAAQRWGMIWWLIEALPKRPWDDWTNWRWTEPEALPDVITGHLLSAARLLKEHRAAQAAARDAAEDDAG